MRSSTCRPDGAPRRPVALLRREGRGDRLRRARLARGSARSRHGPEPHLRRRPRRATPRELAPRRDAAAPRERARLLQLVRDRRDDPRADRRPRSDRLDRRLRGRDRRLRRGLGERRAAARARRHRRSGRRRLQRAEPRRADTRRAAGRDVRDRRLRHQRADLGLAAQLHLDAHGDARLLRCRARPVAPGRPSSRSRATCTGILPADSGLERVAGGFEFTEGPVWTARRCAALQLAEHERDLPLDADGVVTVFRSKSGYTGIGHRPLPPARLERAHVLARRAADDLPARQPARDPRQPARRHHGARGRLRGQAAELARTTSSTARTGRSTSPTRRSGCPIPRDGELGFSGVFRVARRRGHAPDRRARAGRTASRSRRTSAGSTSATGTSSGSSSCATTRRPARARSSST